MLCLEAPYGCFVRRIFHCLPECGAGRLRVWPCSSSSRTCEVGCEVGLSILCLSPTCPTTRSNSCSQLLLLGNQRLGFNCSFISPRLASSSYTWLWRRRAGSQTANKTNSSLGRTKRCRSELSTFPTEPVCNLLVVLLCQPLSSVF